MPPSAGGVGSRRSLLLVCALLAGLSAGVFCCQQGSVCNLPCCDVQSDCSAALHLTCRCPDLPLMALREGDIPSTVQSISISGPAQVTLYENAVHALTSLVKMDLHDIKDLELKPGGLVLQQTTMLRTLQVKNASTVNISSFAFSGFWDYGTEIKLHEIAVLNVHQKAFAYHSSSAPRLSMINISLLEVASEGLSAPISELALSFVNMTSCGSESFSGSINHINMEGVKIAEMKKWCIKGSVNSEKLSVKSCSIGTIDTLGISGKFASVGLSKTNITTVKEHGFMLNVVTMRMTESHITELMPRGMNISATNFINISQLRVDVLRKHGLIGLAVPNGTATFLPHMRIHQLEVMQADEGSLVFAKGIDANIRRVSVHSPEPPMCPMQKWVRWLVAKDEDGTLSQMEHQLLRQLYRPWLCGDGPIAHAENNGGSSQEASSQKATGDELPQTANKEGVSQEEVHATPGHDDSGDTPSTSSRVTPVDEASEIGGADLSRQLTLVISPADTDDSTPLRTGPTNVAQTTDLRSAVAADGFDATEGDTARASLPREIDASAEPESAKDGGSFTRPGTFSSGTQSPPEEELRLLKLQVLQLTRQVVGMESIIGEIRAQNESRTWREVIVVMACACYFGIKMYRRMCRIVDKKNDECPGQGNNSDEQSQSMM